MINNLYKYKSVLLKIIIMKIEHRKSHKYLSDKEIKEVFRLRVIQGEKYSKLTKLFGANQNAIFNNIKKYCDANDIPIILAKSISQYSNHRRYEYTDVTWWKFFNIIEEIKSGISAKEISDRFSLRRKTVNKIKRDYFNNPYFYDSLNDFLRDSEFRNSFLNTLKCKMFPIDMLKIDHDTMKGKSKHLEDVI